MENKIPLPTDNIFKFYALFGLVLFIFSAAAVIFVTNSANAVSMSTIPQIYELQQIDKPSLADAAKLAVLKKTLEIALSDRKFFLNAIGAVAGLSMLVMGYGFIKWHTAVQPVLDETAKVQLELVKLQLEKLRKKMESKPVAPPAAPTPPPAEVKS